jgi:hypothetical protein
VTRRIVRVSPSFFDALDAQLPADRGATASANDFAAFDVLEIVEVFATRWDELQRHPRDKSGQLRIYAASSRLVAHYAVAGLGTADGSVDLLDITIDVEGLPDPEVDADE